MYLGPTRLFYEAIFIGRGRVFRWRGMSQTKAGCFWSKDSACELITNTPVYCQEVSEGVPRFFSVSFPRRSALQARLTIR
jgi:hypothetical protein